jgi:hypothetical protein
MSLVPEGAAAAAVLGARRRLALAAVWLPACVLMPGLALAAPADRATPAGACGRSMAMDRRSPLPFEPRSMAFRAGDGVTLGGCLYRPRRMATRRWSSRPSRVPSTACGTVRAYGPLTSSWSAAGPASGSA